MKWVIFILTTLSPVICLFLFVTRGHVWRNLMKPEGEDFIPVLHQTVNRNTLQVGPSGVSEELKKRQSFGFVALMRRTSFTRSWKKKSQFRCCLLLNPWLCVSRTQKINDPLLPCCSLGDWRCLWKQMHKLHTEWKSNPESIPVNTSGIFCIYVSYRTQFCRDLILQSYLWVLYWA